MPIGTPLPCLAGPASCRSPTAIFPAPGDPGTGWGGGPYTPSVVRALRKPLVPALVVSIVMLAAGCVGGPNGGSRDGAPATPTQASGSSNPLTVKVTALGAGDAATLQRAAQA